VLQFLQQLGRVRANEVSLQSAAGEILYQSPPATYKAGREAPVWFAHLLAPQPAKYTFPLRGGVLLVVQAQPSRAVLDAWDDVTRLSAIAAAMFVVANALAFWSVKRALEPFPVIADGLERIQQGDLAFRLPSLAGTEAHAIGAAFNRMAQAVQDKVLAERKAHDAEARLEERREMAPWRTSASKRSGASSHTSCTTNSVNRSLRSAASRWRSRARGACAIPRPATSRD